LRCRAVQLKKVMKKFVLLIAVISAAKLAAQPIYFPPENGEWATLSPDSLGWCSENVEALYEYLESEDTEAFLVLKNGKIVLEKYFGNSTPDDVNPWFSAGKSLMAVLVGIAQEEGFLSIDDPVSDYQGEGWTDLPPEKEQLITIRNQLTMTSGLDENIFNCTLDTCLTYKADAGERWAYHNGPYSLLRNVLEEATGLNINVITRDFVRSPIGMDGFWLSLGYSNIFRSTARSMARFGLLVQNGGTWDGEKVLADSVYLNNMLTSSQQLNPSYGYLWWLNGQSSYIPPHPTVSFPGSIAPDAPEDVVVAAGAQGQFVSIAPSEGLIFVRQGNQSAQEPVPLDLHNDIWQRLAALECTPTSTSNLSPPEISIFPNPVTDVLSIRTERVPDVVRIFSTNGKLVQTARATKTLDVRHLPKGWYWVRIKSGQQFWRKPFLKQ